MRISISRPGALAAALGASLLLNAALLLSACSGSPADGGAAAADTAVVPLTDLGSARYEGFAGGLYPGGINTIPAVHAAAGAARARLIRPLDPAGNPSASGRIVLLSVGMSNTSNEFCGNDAGTACSAGTFVSQAAADPDVNHTTLTVVNGAQGGQDAVVWTAPTARVFDVVRDQRLAPAGLTERQVQVVWLKQADASPRVALPSGQADAYVLERYLGQIVRALRVRYPNLRQVFLSSRTYGGYANSNLNPEPYAYESGLAVKWLIQAQIEQASAGTVDPVAGSLAYDAAAPWLAWGPYLWANGMHPRSDGLTWAAADFGSDGTHPSSSGRAKVSAQLLAFFKTSATTRCWFLRSSAC